VKLIFVHGAGGGKNEWLCQTLHFLDSEAVALPGHPAGTPCSSVDEYMEWLHGYIQQQKYRDVVLVGHSMGGAIVQLYALKYGTALKGIILVGTGARLRVAPAILSSLKEMTTNADAWQQFLSDNIYRQVIPEAKPAVIAERVRIGPAVMLNDSLACDKFDIMDRVQSIRLPTMIIVGSQDTWTPPKYSQYLASRITGATQVTIDGGSHWVFLEKPQEVNRAISDFLTRLS